MVEKQDESDTPTDWYTFLSKLGVVLPPIETDDNKAVCPKCGETYPCEGYSDYCPHNFKNKV